MDHKIDDELVIKGPEYGEDAAVIRLGDNNLVIHLDPISTGIENIGWLSIHIPANDIAVTGAEPRWALPSVQVPEDMPDSDISNILDDISEASSKLGVSLIGGHTEKLEFIDRPLITTTMIGLTNKPIFTSDSKPGDLIVQVGAAGIEGTWILVSDYAKELVDRGVSQEIIKEVGGWRQDISVVKDALTFDQIATSMHDVTEGGLLQGLYEMARASGNRFVIDKKPIVRKETVRICNLLKIEPLALISSGCLIATVPPDEELPMGKAIGRVEEGDGETLFRDEIVEENTDDELFKAINKLVN